MNENTKILLVCPFEDNKNGTYIHDTLIGLNCQVAMFDWNKIGREKGIKRLNKELIEVTKQLTPDITIIIKGLGIIDETIKEMRKVHEHPIVGWIFDVTLGGHMVKDVKTYTDMIKELNIFYTIDESAISELKELGINAKWLPEACYPPMHGEQVLNSVQKKKFGADVVFMGSVGSIHPNRAEILEAIADTGIDFKIYGEVLYPKDTEPDWVKEHHTGYAVKNEMHSTVCNSSKIVIGIDGWPERNMGYSMRVYMTLCPGAFYLNTATKGIEKVFEPGKHLDIYKNKEELVEKILYYLENDKEREEIARNGQKEVLSKHIFDDRISTILKDSKK